MAGLRQCWNSETRAETTALCINRSPYRILLSGFSCLLAFCTKPMDWQGIEMAAHLHIRENRLAAIRKQSVRATIDDLDSLRTVLTPLEQVKLWSIKSFNRCKVIHEHSQLRHNMALVGDVLLYNSGNCITKHCAVTNERFKYLQLKEPVSTLSATETYLITGNFEGMYSLKPFGKPCQSGNISLSQVIINHLNPSISRSGEPVVYISSNEHDLISLDANTLETRIVCNVGNSSNCSATSPDYQLLAVVGDSKTTNIISLRDGTIINTLDGHLDHCFAVAWQQSSRYLATGSQDMTTRIYDTRMMQQAITVIASKQSAVRSLLYIDDTLCIAEDCDYVQFANEKGIDSIEFFGDITGTCHSNGFLYAGVNDRHIGGIFSMSEQSTQDY